jgi:dihydropyrimidinase
VGADADIVIWDERDFVLKNEQLHHEVDYTPYDGMRLKAWPGVTLSRGEVVWDGIFHPKQGRGELVACGLPTLMPRRP